MKAWYLELKIEYRVVVWSLIAIIGLFVSTIPCYFFSLMEIPQGILLGGFLGIIIYLLLGLFDNKDKPKKSLIITSIIISVRLLLIAGILFLVGWLYYGLGFKAFNIFAVMFGYFVSLAVNIILVEREKVGGRS